MFKNAFRFVNSISCSIESSCLSLLVNFFRPNTLSVVISEFRYAYEILTPSCISLCNFSSRKSLDASSCLSQTPDLLLGFGVVFESKFLKLSMVPLAPFFLSPMDISLITLGLD
jgi:hypothetical protein